MKIILLSVLTVLCVSFAGCAGGKKGKSAYRNYEGNNSPNIRMYDERPGYPLNTR